MPTHAEQRVLPYSPQQLFDLVAKVENYPEFLPWCLNARIQKCEDSVLWADLIIGYKVFQEKFASKVTLESPHHIHVEYIEGPMKYLSNHWKFIDNGDGTTTIDFFVDFEFKSIIMQNLMGLFFNEAVKRMVSAFETRAQELYS